MEPRALVTPLKPHRGRHAGIIASTLLAVTAVGVWVGDHGSAPSPVTPDPSPPPATAAAAIATSIEQRPSAIELPPGARTTVVTERVFPRVIAATGAVTYDPTRTHRLHTPVAGALVLSPIASLGRFVRAGETVGTVYSLEVYFASLALLDQIRDFHSQVDVDRERYRLMRWGMRREQIAQIERHMKPTAGLPLIARMTGRVVSATTARQFVDPYTTDYLVIITDPAFASVFVTVPRSDASLLRVGGPVQITLAPNRRVAGTIGEIEPTRDAVQTVRVDLATGGRSPTPPQGEANVELLRTTVRGPAVPTAAVTRDGDRATVYVVRGSLAEPRTITLGATRDDFTHVAGGLEPGDTILADGYRR